MAYAHFNNSSIFVSMQIRNIVFDLGGVLLNLDFDKTRQAYMDLGMKDFDQHFGLGHAASYFKDYEKGLLTDEAFIQAIQQTIGGEVEASAVESAWNALLLDFPKERVDFLKALSHRYRIFLFSNTNHIHMKYFKKNFMDLYGFAMDALFEKAYYSHEAGVRKPDAAAYQLVLDENNLIAAETVFIDDALNNVEAAIAVGMQGIHLEPGKTILELGL